MFKYYNSIAEQYIEIDTRVHRKNMMKIDGRIPGEYGSEKK